MCVLYTLPEFAKRAYRSCPTELVRYAKKMVALAHRTFVLIVLVGMWFVATTASGAEVEADMIKAFDDPTRHRDHDPSRDPRHDHTRDPHRHHHHDDRKRHIAATRPLAADEIGLVIGCCFGVVTIVALAYTLERTSLLTPRDPRQCPELPEH